MNVVDEWECLVEWAENNEVLIPIALSVCFTYLETVYLETKLCLWELIIMFLDILIFSVNTGQVDSSLLQVFSLISCG